MKTFEVKRLHVLPQTPSYFFMLTYVTIQNKSRSITQRPYLKIRILLAD